MPGARETGALGRLRWVGPSHWVADLRFHRPDQARCGPMKPVLPGGSDRRMGPGTSTGGRLAMRRPGDQRHQPPRPPTLDRRRGAPQDAAMSTAPIGTAPIGTAPTGTAPTGTAPTGPAPAASARTGVPAQPRHHRRDAPAGLWARIRWRLRGRPPLCCSFCGASRHQVQHLVAGDHAAICTLCVVRCLDVLPVLEDPPESDLRCLYCARRRPEVENLVGAPARYLCRGCADDCVAQHAAMEVAAGDTQLSLPGLET